MDLKPALNFTACPYCGTTAVKNIFTLRYYDTILHTKDINDFNGAVLMCQNCGIYFLSPRFSLVQFQILYNLIFKGSIFTRTAQHPLTKL